MKDCTMISQLSTISSAYTEYSDKKKIPGTFAKKILILRREQVHQSVIFCYTEQVERPFNDSNPFIIQKVNTNSGAILIEQQF